MAKKKDGSGSNLGLIITLVFFVLSTVILGVTTYMGFSAQDEKDKAVAKMQQEKTQAD
jgi:flagellar basal body-associated protein FliL